MHKRLFTARQGKDNDMGDMEKRKGLGFAFLAFGDASYNTALNRLINNVLITVTLTPIYRGG